ncbi:MAG: AraC family transcriptional regulator [Verrucomicrobiota bacterium]
MQDVALYFPDGGTSDIWGSVVTACGRTQVMPGESYPPDPRQHPRDHLFWLPRGGRMLDCYQLLYISAGGGVFESLETGSIQIESGSAFLLFPKVWHRYAPDFASGWTESFLELRGPTLERLRDAGVLRPRNAVFNPGVTPDLVEAFDALCRLASEEGAGGREQMAALGMHILARIVFSRRASKLSAEEQAVRLAEAHLRENPGGRFNIRMLARKFGVAYDPFRRCFKTLTGLPPKQYHRLLQMRRAQEMLLHSRRSVAQIADDLGFHSAFHFSAAFKEHTGLAPSHWRERKEQITANQRPARGLM